MQKLKLPEYGFRMREKNKQILIFDEFRHRWVVLTPEEWVRQHYLKFLVTEKRFPKQLLAVEKKVMVNGLPQRFDLMVCDRKGNPLLVAEFKSPSVEITQPVFDQAGRYNGILRAPISLFQTDCTITSAGLISRPIARNTSPRYPITNI